MTSEVTLLNPTAFETATQCLKHARTVSFQGTYAPTLCHRKRCIKNCFMVESRKPQMR
jgi:hypothetical protein